MTYLAMARRWRPKTFAEVTAQSHITETLQRAVQSGRLASAYLFSGPRGSGKTTVARILAKAVNCEKPRDGEPCGCCETCLSIDDGRSLDVLEIDGASNNSVDDVRELRENVRYAPSVPGRRKVYVIDEVHMLSTGAFNALLKTLEEPPAHVIFVFATTEVRKVPATILSRCQRFDFRRLLTDEILQRLRFIREKDDQQKIDIEDGALFTLAKRADGSLRDALSLLDQVLSSTSGRITEAQVAQVLGLVPEETYFELTEAILGRDAVRALGVLHAALHQGVDAAGFTLGLAEHLRNLLLLAVDARLRDSVQLGEVHLKQAEALAARFKSEDLLHLLNRAAALFDEVRRASQPNLLLEAALVEMSRFESRVVLGDLLQRLEGGAGGGGARDSAPGPATRAAGEARGTPAAGRGETPARSEPPRGTPAPRTGTRRPSSARGEGDFTSPGGMAPAMGDVLPAGERPSGSTPSGPAPHSSAPEGAGAPPGASHPAAGSVGGHASGIGAVGGRPAAPDLGPAVALQSPPINSAPATAVAPRPKADVVLPTGVDLDRVRERWEDFTHALRGSRATLAHCLSEGRPVRLQGRTLEVYFPPEHSFHLHLFQEAVKKRELEPYLHTYFGHPLQVALCSEAEPAAPPSVPSARLTPDDIARSRRGAIEDVVRSTPRLEEIIDAFDGEVLDDHGA